MLPKKIRLENVRQNNLKGFDLDLPLYRVIAITGLSGSGKSSLALDTLYAEGQRRYVETFSAYARQFLERMPRPQAGRIENIPAAIAIEQTNPVKSSRSTLGTLTEVNHFVKMFFFREAHLFCPHCGRAILSRSPLKVASELVSRHPKELVVITALVEVKEDFSFLRDGLVAAGFFRVWTEGRIENIMKIEPQPAVEVVVDRVHLKEENLSRLTDSLEKAFALGRDRILVHLPDSGVLKYTNRYACAYCEVSFTRPTPNLFSFNSPLGACLECRGFGRIIDIDWDLVIPDQTLSIQEGAVRVFEAPAASGEREDLLHFCLQESIPVDRPWKRLSEKARRTILFGKGKWYGVKGFFDWLERKRYKAHVRIFLSRFRAYLPCPICGGSRFKKETLAYRLADLTIGDLYDLSLSQAASFFRKLNNTSLDAASLLLHEEINRRLSYLCEVGLGYLSLSRQSRTLSGGEVARAMLTRALASSLVETLYILDEPSRGLHARDSSRVVKTLKRLSSQRNTVCVVEHDPDIILSADHAVDLGPGAGERGGQLLYAGRPKGLLRLGTPTGEALFKMDKPSRSSGRKKVPLSRFLEVVGARENNLKEINVLIPKGALTVITGVSGSGKSTLLELVLFRGGMREKGLPAERPGAYKGLRGLEDIEEIILVDQSPIGRTPRSNPASYLKLYDLIRRLMVQTSQARARSLTPSYFSFNTPGGRCEVCQGQGSEKVEMQFLSDVYLPCPACQGKRFRPEVLEVRYEGKNIAEILDMTMSEAAQFFANRDKLVQMLSGPLGIGLGYLRLGQPIQTLSGGEAQRLKLANLLFTRPKKNALILIDEPTVGLHLRDVEQINQAFLGLVQQGNTVVIVEHHFDVLKQADWVVDLGPEGGEDGGRVVYQGPLDGLARAGNSITSKWFGDYLVGKKAEGLAAKERQDPAPRGIKIMGARHHNLKNLTFEIPRNKLVAITGPSGSGKSTLAFDILFAEGQRRYVESLSTYVRQFIRLYERPDADLILGLPPTVAIEQRTSQAGPRSTVATLTEIYHYLRLLYAKLAEPHCPRCGRTLATQSLDEMVNRLVQDFRGQRLAILVPLVRRRKGFHREILGKSLRSGYTSARIDGEMVSLSPLPRLSRYQEHTIEAKAGEVKAIAEHAPELRELIEEAFSEGRMEAVALGSKREVFLSPKYTCPDCGVGLPPPDPLLFSFNSSAGACTRCEGMGRVEAGPCPVCQGMRLKKEALVYLISGKSIGTLCHLSVEDALGFIQGLKFEETKRRIAEPILSECTTRLKFLRELGLGYLTLGRSGHTLSGGEGQRIRLSSELGSNLTGVCYILDEPTIGLHPRDNSLLIEALKSLKERGNSVLVVEHDEETLKASDWVIDLGPGGGAKGGEITCEGTPDAILSCGSLTGILLSDQSRYRISSKGRADKASRWLSIEGACARNLKRVTARVPLHSMTCITGVSGSGKSTLLMEVLYPNLLKHLAGHGRPLTNCRAILGTEEVKKVLVVDHSPIGRTPRSTPATYIGIMDGIRQLMANLPESRARGWKPGRFSFNVAGGRCKDCSGQGTLKVEMKFLPEVYVTCETCGGKRYNDETLSVTYKGKHMAEILEMTFFEARDFFSAVPHLNRAIHVVCELGLGYLRLGQSSPTLSGGEAQRIKLAEEFVKSSAGGAIFVLDEPTTGLHMADIQKLLQLFHGLVERGDTILVIEHNLEVVKEADWIIDLGPEGGEGGGEIVYEGPPHGLLKCPRSHTATYLKRFLETPASAEEAKKGWA
jgi:excinuclease ABC subunit A